MTKDRYYLVATACGILATLFAAILFPAFRNSLFWLLVAVGCCVLLLGTTMVVCLVKFSRAVSGPKSLTGTRCPNCEQRHGLEEVGRVFLHPNVKFNIDHFRVEYRCTACGHEQQQEELVGPTQQSERSEDRPESPVQSPTKGR